MSFNPDRPAALGLQWCPVHEIPQAMTSTLVPFAAKFTPSISATVNHVWLYSPTSIPGNPESYQLDIYLDGTLPGTTVTTITAYPAADAGATDAWWWNGSTAGTTNLYQKVNNPTQTPVAILNGVADDDFIYNPDGRQYVAQFFFDGLTAAAADQHIVKIRTEARVQPLSTFNDRQAMTVAPYLIFDGILYYGPEQTFVDRQPGGHLCSAEWPVHPALLRSWLPDDLVAFATGGTAAAGWVVRPTNATSIYAAIYSVNIQIDHVGSEVRKALAWITPANQVGLAGWFQLQLFRPGSGGSPWPTGWLVSSGSRYLLAFRRQTSAPGGLQLSVQALSGFDTQTPAPNGWSRTKVTMLSNPQVPVLVTDIDDGRSWAPTIAVMNVFGEIAIADSQPYAVLEHDSAVYASIDFRQYFTTPASLPDPDFGLLRVTLGRTDPSITASISFKVRRASDDVQFGSTVTITAAEFDTDPETPHQTGYALYRTLVRNLVTPATLATSTTYYLQATSSADPLAPWRIESARTVLPGDTPPAGINDITAGGTNGLIINGVSHPESDSCLILMTVPVAPANLEAISQTPGAAPCVWYQHITWDATSLGAGFDYYELQRMDRPLDLWQTIAHVTVESVTAFHDYEALYNYPVNWRIRVVRRDGAVSDWTTVTTATTASTCCGYVLTSNEYGGLTVWYDDVSDGDRETDLPQNATTRQFYDRDYQVTFYELENRGAVFKRTLLVAAERALNGTEETLYPGLGTFEQLLSICRPSRVFNPPYVCVHELDTGDRWFASIQTPTVAHREPAGQYTATIEVTETTSTPHVATVTVGP